VCVCVCVRARALQNRIASSGCFSLVASRTVVMVRSPLMNGKPNVLVGKLTPDLHFCLTDASWELVLDNETKTMRLSVSHSEQGARRERG